MPHRPLCENCPFLGEPFKQAVAGEWWVEDTEWAGPDIMCIGQNPGAREDDEGSPFVGPSGALLKNALRRAGIKRAFMTNAVQCAGEVDLSTAKLCYDRLQAEIDAVRPKWIFVFGNVPLQRFMSGRGTITALSGKEIWHNATQAWLLPVLHPAAILRNMGKEGTWTADIMRFGRLIRGEINPPPAVPPVTVSLVDSGQALIGLSKLLETEPMVAYDFEANMEPWWSKWFRPLCIGFSFDGTTASVVPLAHPEVDTAWRQMIWKWLRGVMPQLLPHDAQQRLVHNGLYDDLVWYRLTGVLPHPTWDTMIGLQLMDEEQWKSLKWAGRAYLGWPDWDIDPRKPHPLADLYPYNGYDAAALPGLWQIERDALAEDEWLLRYAEAVEMPKLRALERMLARGIFVDRPAAAGLLRTAWRQQQDADRLVPLKNPASPAQVANWLYHELQLPIMARGKSNQPSTAMPIINRLAQRYPEARLILDCRRPRKKISTYFRPVDRDTKSSFDGRYHAEYRITKVETGRLSSFFHTIPRDTSVRPMFSAPEGRVLISADYRQIEARLCAWLALGQPDSWDDVPKNSMLWAFHERQDIYTLFACLALHRRPEAITKSDRQIMGKVPVLAQLYAISWQGLQEYAWNIAQIDWTQTQARSLHALFQRTFPEFPAWHRLEEIKLRNRGWSRSPVGRMRRLPDALSGNKEAIRSGINFPSQSLASDITQAAMILLDHMGARIVGNIHDALLIEAPLAKASAQADIIRLVMQRDAVEYLRPLGLYLPDGLIEVEITFGPWGLGVEDLTPPVASATL